MVKDSYYFPHDSNAKDDPKILMVFDTLGCEGYGIYWVLIETLRDQQDYKCQLKILPGLARRFGTTFEKIKAVVFNFDLFTVEDETFFLSESLCRRMERYDKKKEFARNAGKISALKRMNLTNVQRTFNGRSTDAEQPFNQYSIREYSIREDSIVKESKEKKKTFSPFVFDIFKILREKIDGYRPNHKHGQEKTELDIIDKMIRIDNREPEIVLNLLTWYPIGEQYIPEIFSAKALREKYDKLDAAYKRWKYQKDNKTEKQAEIENRYDPTEENNIRKMLGLDD